MRNLSVIDAIGEALLLEGMTKSDLCDAISGHSTEIARELRHLVQSRMVMPGIGDPMGYPTYHLTRRGREWAKGAMV